MKKFMAILKDENGQGMLEYILLVGVLATIILVFKGQISGLITKWTGNVGDAGDNVFK
ncbi:MAG: Flp1 family type IVb pilin [Oligoflexia bacterium]|nr:Flp1 family type IVb pilin [Oligoflexia bacterium]